MMRLVKRIAVAALAFVLLACGAAFSARHELFRRALDLPELTHDAAPVRTVRVKMRDGIHLRTDIHLPKGEGPWPAVLMRNPYAFAVTFPFLCEVAARYGFACVNQEVRGAGDSEGEWLPMFNERNDGLDTLHWLVGEPWQDGNIALAGMSYLAATQWAVADRLPPEVKTMLPMMFGTDVYRTAYERGMFKHEVLTAWAAFMPDGQMSFLNGDAYHAMIRHRPALESDVELGVKLDWYREWIGSPSREEGFWAGEGPVLLREMPAKVTVPVLMFGGWYDLFLGAQLEDFERLASRSKSRFVIGPWHHLQRSEVAYEGDFGAGGQLNMMLDWLGHHLRGEPLDQPVGVVETYSFGEGEWHVRERFPPAGTATVSYHLDAITAANGCEGGRLAGRAAADPGSISYRYDPDDPVPTRGGAKLLGFAFYTFDSPIPGSVDQADLCERDDVLTFVSEPLDQPMHLAGRVQVRLTVRSDAPDTAFTAKLIEVDRDGGARNVRDGITTITHRGPYTPGAAAEVEIELWPIEWRFPKGARLRLDVSSSNFPAFHAHPNRAGPWALVKDAVVAKQTVEGGRVSLPVLRSE